MKAIKFYIKTPAKAISGVGSGKKPLIIILCMFFYTLQLTAQVNMTLGLQAYYPFTGNALDASGNGNNPTTNTATLTTDRFGSANSAYFFSGSTYMQIPNAASISPSSQISICAWMKPTAFYSGTCHGNSPLMKGNTENQAGNYYLRFDDYYYTGGQNCSNPIPDVSHEGFYGNSVRDNPMSFISLNNWYSVVYTYNGSIAKLYVNCTLVDTKAASLTFNNSDPLLFGKTLISSFPYWFTGSLDEIRLYNRAINQAEVNVYGGCFICGTDTSYAVSKCDNQQVTLHARAGTSYSWSPTTGLSSTTIQSPICSITGNTTYVATITDSLEGCTYYDTIKVQVHAAPVSNMKDTTICKADTLRLTAGSAGPIGTYSWSPNYNISSTTVQSPDIWPAVTTTYVATVTNKFGCSIKDSVVITVVDCPCEQLVKKLQEDLLAEKDANAALNRQIKQTSIVLENLSNNTAYLDQNTPNPFTERTTITYAVPKVFKEARIIFANTNGEIIKTVPLKQGDSGILNVYGRDLNSGLYTYTLVIDGKTIITRKMIKQ